MLTDYWYIACCCRELGRRPLGIRLLGKDIVLFRTTAGTVVALEDRCAHRNAPLSAGKVCGESIQCPYHGWRYERSGAIATVPARPEGSPPPVLRIPAYPCMEKAGYIWVCPSGAPVDPDPPQIPYLGLPGWIEFRLKTRFPAAVETCLENFLDCPHATYVHRFWFRTPAARPVKAVVTSLADGAVAEYFEEPRDASLVWWLLSRKHSQMTHRDRFIAPSASQVDYIFSDDRHYSITSFCTPVTDRETIVYTVIAFRAPYIGGLIRLGFEPLARWIIQQDVQILKRQQQTVDQFGGTRFCTLETDLLTPFIRQWRKALATNLAPPKEGQQYDIELRLYSARLRDGLFRTT